MVIFAVLFLPGVLLHEGSHFLIARLLGVRTGRISLLPQHLGNGRLRLGYVETASVDLLRDALIGAAPLLAGGVFIAYSAAVRLHLPAIWEGGMPADPRAWSASLAALLTTPDFWLWFYITFVVSSTMLPSPSDRRAWLPLLLVMLVLVALSVWVGAGPWMWDRLAPLFDRSMQAIVLVFALSFMMHAVLWPPLALFRRVLQRVTGLQVV